MNAPLQPVSMRKERGHLPRLSVPYDPNKPRDARFWTDAEIQIVRENFSKRGGVDACVRQLPNRHRGTIYQMAHKLGLRAHAQPAERRHIECTPELEARIRARWPALIAKGATTAFAVELDVPKHWLVKHATRLGLTVQQRKEAPWTAAEDELMKKVPLHSPEAAAQMFRARGFNRTATAIVVRAKRLNLSRRYKETLSATAAARILGIDNKSVTRLCIDGTLAADKRETRRLPQQGGHPWSIRPAALRQYIIDHLASIDIRKVDKVAFVDLLVNGTSAPSGEGE